MKRYNTISVFLISVLAVVFSSCEKTVDNVKLPDISPVMVAQSFLEANQDTIKLYLSRSNPIFYNSSNGFSDVPNADVYISDGSTKLKLPFFAGIDQWTNGYYLSNTGGLKLLPGVDVSLKIIDANGDSIWSNCRIPDVPKYEISFLRIDSTKSEWDNTYNFDYSFKFKSLNDEAKNYYHIEAMGYYSEFGNNYYDNLYDESGDYGHYQVGNNKSTTIHYNTWNNRLDSIVFYVLNTDEAYYLYHKTAKQLSNDNPFSEPVIVYSNIENGLGAFCAFSRSQFSLIIP